VPRCAEVSCGRWRPERLAPKWAAGIRLNGEWFCSRPCVQIAARAGLDTQAPPASLAGSSLRSLRLGVLLRHLNVITEGQLKAALESQRESGCRLGAELQRLGHATGEQILRALAAQSSVSYLASFEVSRVKNGPTWLTTDTVRALGLVPFEVDASTNRNRLHLICQAPVPRAAVRALQKLTGWTAEVYLVHDDVWERAVQEYQPSVGTVADGEVRTVGGIDDAAALVAETASVDRTVTMRHAKWNRFTWVRVEGPTQVSNFLVPVMEGTCLAAHTAH
jgi:hypothetical protein